MRTTQREPPAGPGSGTTPGRTAGPAAPLRALQRSAGNRAVARLVSERQTLARNGGAGTAAPARPALASRLSEAIALDRPLDELERIIREAPESEVRAVAADAAVMGRLRQGLPSTAWRAIEPMLRSGLLVDGTLGTSYIRIHHRARVRMYRTPEIVLSRNVRFVFDESIPREDRDRFRREVQDGLARHVMWRWKLRLASAGGARPADGDYPIRFEINEVERGGHPIRVLAGHGRSATGERGSTYYVESMPGDSPDQRRAYYAHEMTHLFVSAHEEYPTDDVSDYDRGRTITHDQSIMGNFYEEADLTRVEIKDRHLQPLIPFIRHYFPDRQASIVR